MNLIGKGCCRFSERRSRPRGLEQEARVRARPGPSLRGNNQGLARKQGLRNSLFGPAKRLGSNGVLGPAGSRFPHGRLSRDCAKPVAAFIRLAEPIPFDGAPDGRPRRDAPSSCSCPSRRTAGASRNPFGAAPAELLSDPAFPASPSSSAADAAGVPPPARRVGSRFRPRGPDVPQSAKLFEDNRDALGLSWIVDEALERRDPETRPAAPTARPQERPASPRTDLIGVLQPSSTPDRIQGRRDAGVRNTSPTLSEKNGAVQLAAGPCTTGRHPADHLRRRHDCPSPTFSRPASRHASPSSQSTRPAGADHRTRLRAFPVQDSWRTAPRCTGRADGRARRRNPHHRRVRSREERTRSRTHLTAGHGARRRRRRGASPRIGPYTIEGSLAQAGSPTCSRWRGARDCSTSRRSSGEDGGAPGRSGLRDDRAPGQATARSKRNNETTSARRASTENVLGIEVRKGSWIPVGPRTQNIAVLCEGRRVRQHDPASLRRPSTRWASS